MEQDKIELITHTLDGTQVKDLKYKKVDNILIGFVKDLVTGQPNRDFMVTCCWRLNGSLLPKYGGVSRKELYLDLSKINT